MLSQATVALEHFYYGQLFYQGKAQGDLRLLASSPGVKTEHVTEAADDAAIPPMPGSPDGSWALVRGRSTPFMIVQAQIGSKGQAMRHIVLMPVEVLRSLGGNLTALARLSDLQMPVFEQVGATIPLLPMFQANTPGADAQETAMLSLMTATRDRLEVIEALLAAIIQGVQIVIKGAPPELAQRIGFIEGLLALLPPPARFGVTFATHTLPSTRVDAQIRFYSDDPPPPNTLVYQWGATRVEGTISEDEYARFIRSQLRLDTRLVIDQTTALTAVAAWRIKRGDTLAEALKYASYRLKLDTALTNTQPVEASEAAKVLAEDPTLPDTLRAAYVRHLLAFALVLDEIEHADKLAIVVRGQPDLESVILEQMNEALAAGKADRVYRTLARWLSNPLGFNGMYWVELTQRAAIAYSEALARGNQVETLNAFLKHVRRNSENVEIAPIIPHLIDIALPVAVRYQTLAENIFVLAAGSLPANRWQHFITLKPLLAQLPVSLSDLMDVLSGKDPAPPSLLAQVSGDFGDEWRPLLIIRLTEVTLLAGRRDLIDNGALTALIKAAQSSFGPSYDSLLRWIVRNLSDDEVLLKLGLIGSRYLLQILLARGAYDELASELIHQGRLLYPTDKQLNYAAMVRSLMLETPLPVEEVQVALRTLSSKGLKPLPLSMAYFGALEQHRWSPTIENVATELTTLVFSNRLIIEAIQLDLITQLLQYHVQRRDTNYAVRVATLLPAAAARRGEAGLAPLIQMYRALNWDEDVRSTAREALRRFIRRCSDSFAPHAIERFREDLGDEIGAMLNATHTIRRLMGGEELSDYAYSLHTVAQFLYDTGLTYVGDKSELPSIPGLLSDLDSLNGGLNDAERKVLTGSLLEIIRAIATLSEQHRKVHPRENDEQIDALLRGEHDAETTLDIFRVMGGYFARGRRLTARTDRLMSNHPLSDRSAPILMREVQQISRLLKAALRTFLVDTKISINAAAIQGEMESLWGDIPLYERRTLVRDLATDLERIPELMLLMTEKIDSKAFIDSGGTARRLDSNKQRPESTLAFYRFMYGYFRARIRRKE
ncbi:MAG: hypothetical protein IT319_06260 [Anaerolineae bacterium]|nr:hypothetical protein [Anaerolineae bacterium]